MLTNPGHWSEPLQHFISHFVGAPFEKCLIKRLAGDASGRVYSRLSYSPHTWILVEQAPFLLEGNPYLTIQKHLKHHGVHVPQIFAVSPEMGLLIIEDFGDNFLGKVAQNLSPKAYAKYYYLALDELFKIHFDGSTPTSPCIAFSLSFDVKKLSWELFHTQTYLFEKYLKISMSDPDKKILSQFFTHVSETLAQEPKYFTHRDYHSRNIMVCPEKGGKMGILDFQDARMGLCTYDLASLLKDSYVKLPENLVNELLLYYIQEKESREKIKIDKIAFRHLFDRTAIQRNLKAMGTFAYLKLEKNKLDYIKSILPTWNYVQENLQKFPEYKRAEKLLQSMMETFYER